MKLNRAYLEKKFDPLNIKSRLFDRFFAWMYKASERRELRKFSGPNPFPPIFIIGPPRSGSTFLYQVLSNCLDLMYIDNVVHVYNSRLFLGFEKSEERFKGSAHNSYQSKHGNTYSFSKRGPHESSLFWYRYFSKEGKAKAGKMEELGSLIKAISNKYQKHFLFKNLHHSLRLGDLMEALPESKFIVVTRNLQQNVDSILKMRSQKGIGEVEAWSVWPKAMVGDNFASERVMVERQVEEIYRAICACSSLNDQNCLVLNHESNANNPAELVARVSAFCQPKIGMRNGAKLPTVDAGRVFAETLLEGGESTLENLRKKFQKK